MKGPTPEDVARIFKVPAELLETTVAETTVAGGDVDADSFAERPRTRWIDAARAKQLITDAVKAMGQRSGNPRESSLAIASAVIEAYCADVDLEGPPVVALLTRVIPNAPASTDVVAHIIRSDETLQELNAWAASQHIEGFRRTRLDIVEAL